MPPKTAIDVIEEALPEDQEFPDVEVREDEAVIRVDKPEGVEERRVRLPKTTWG
jgi:hypothetical protein